MNVREKVIGIIAEMALLEPSDIQEGATLDSLGVDSLGLVECIFAIEEEYDITIPFNANEPQEGDFDITSVASIISGIEKLVAARG